LLCEDHPVVGSVEDARVALLSRLIDHAPMFPPASLELAEAVDEDARARESAYSFMLGRFVCPASRLAELPEVGRGVSVVLDAPLEAEPRVEAVETSFGDERLDHVGPVPEVYVEIPLDDAVEERLAEVAARGARAKVRCGGAEVPSAGRLGWFMRECRARHVVFKATAGLHHAVRTDGEHGFLNLLAAAVFCDEQALEELDPDGFELSSEGFRWRGRVASPAEIEQARRKRLHSIGSCSFFEPVEELEQLGVLPL
jgi:hypothetical protein